MIPGQYITVVTALHSGYVHRDRDATDSCGNRSFRVCDVHIIASAQGSLIRTFVIRITRLYMISDRYITKPGIYGPLGSRAVPVPAWSSKNHSRVGPLSSNSTAHALPLNPHLNIGIGVSRWC